LSPCIKISSTSCPRRKSRRKSTIYSENRPSIGNCILIVIVGNCKFVFACSMCLLYIQGCQFSAP
jgi:hypothetical protein